LPELVLIEGIQPVAMKRDESLSPFFSPFVRILPSLINISITHLWRRISQGNWPRDKRFGALARDPHEQWMGKDCVLLLSDVSARAGVSCWDACEVRSGPERTQTL